MSSLSKEFRYIWKIIALDWRKIKIKRKRITAHCWFDQHERGQFNSNMMFVCIEISNQTIFLSVEWVSQRIRGCRHMGYTRWKFPKFMFLFICICIKQQFSLDGMSVHHLYAAFQYLAILAKFRNHFCLNFIRMSCKIQRKTDSFR